METTGGGILSRLGEKVLGWIALALVALGAVAVYQMPAETKTAIWNGAWRSFVWVVLAAVMPWIGKLFIRRVLAFGTNWAGVAWLGGLCAANLIAGVLLLTAWPSGGWGWFAAIGAMALAGTYNYLVTEYLADTSGY